MKQSTLMAAVLVSLLAHGLAEHVNKAEDKWQRLRTPATYLVAVPRVVRPNQEVRVYVSILAMISDEFIVTASIRKGEEEVVSTSETFTEVTTRLAILMMPPNTQSGNYTLAVAGYTSSARIDQVFHNVTKLTFQQKHVSVIIQTDKLIYQKYQSVNYRVLAYQPNLLPVPAGSLDIYVRDAADQIVRRYPFQQLRNGVLEGTIGVHYPIKQKAWTIEVHGFGQVYTQQFRAEKYYTTVFDVNITMPEYIFDNEYALAGLMTANHSAAGIPVRGNTTLRLEIRPPGVTDEKLFQNIRRPSTTFTGVLSFSFPLNEIKKFSSDLAGTELVLYADVVDWRGHEINDHSSASTIIRKSGYQIRYVGGKIRTFKPGATLPAYIAVYAEDGSKHNNRLYSTVQITTTVQKISGKTDTHETISRIIPDDSVVRYEYQTEEDDSRVDIIASYGLGREDSIELVATRHYTESNHYLQVSTSTIVPRLDHYTIFTVTTSIYVPQIQYMILSKGVILATAPLFMTSTQKTFSIAASRDMIPDATLLVYGTLNDGEVLADSLTFHIQGVQSNGLVVDVNYGKDFSRDTVEIISILDPMSFAVFSVEDYEFVSRGAHNFLTQAKVEDELLSYIKETNTSYKHTWYKDYSTHENVFFTAPSSAIDANETFQHAGLVVYTDANLVRIPASIICNYSLGFLPCYDGACYSIEQRCDGVWQCSGGADELGCPEAPYVTIRNPLDHLTRIWDHYDDRSWGWFSKWSLGDVGSLPAARDEIHGYRGDLEKHVKLPIRPGTWMIQGISLSTINGLQFNSVPAVIDTTRSFYIQVEAPKSCFKGEQLGIQVAVFNYFHQPIEVMLTLADSEDYRFIKVEDFGYVHSYNPRTVRGDIQIMVELPAGHSRFVHFPILPVDIGKFSVKIIADSIVRKQVEQKSIKVEWNGITNYYNTPFLIDLVNSGSVYIPYLWVAVPERFVDPAKRELLYVPGSGKTTMSVSGDVVGPAFTSSFLDAYKIFNKLVYGDGQQYLFNLAVNMYWARFLDKINRMDSDTLATVLEGMAKELQRVYSYIVDGAFSMRRKKSPTSVWLTSFGLDVLSKCSYQEWEDILYVDVDVLKRMSMWLVRQQNPDTGAFTDPAPDFDYKMRSNITDAEGQPVNVSLTAFAVIGLTSVSKILTAEEQSEVLTARDVAAEFVARYFYQLTAPFDICLCTYALHVANHKMRADAFLTMQQIARTDNFLYWSEVPITYGDSIIVDNIPYLMPKELPGPLHSKAIHGTAYALMVYMINNKLQEAIPIVRWLETQRNYEHGFDSAQDTIAALQALSMFAELETNRDFYSMQVNLRSTSSPSWAAFFKLERGDLNGYESSSIPNVWGSVGSVAEGTGYAMLQMKTQVNVEHQWQLRQPPVRAFDLEIDYLRFFGKNASMFEMNVCARWVATQISYRSGSAILEVNIPTGYYVRKQTLRKYQRAGRIQSQRSRFTKQKAVLYFDYVDTEGGCWYFTGERLLPVANGTIQHLIRIQDSSEPALHNTSLFTTYDLYHLHICQVCGSFQCPYCPDYNTATSLLGQTDYSRIIQTGAAIFVHVWLGQLLYDLY